MKTGTRQWIVIKALTQLVREGEAVLTRFYLPGTNEHPGGEKFIYKLKVK